MRIPTLLFALALLPGCQQTEQPASETAPAPGAGVESHLAIFNLESREARTIFSERRLFEAPNWTPDGRHLIYNAQGLLYRIPVEGGQPEVIPTGDVNQLNNDHGISPDGTLLAISNRDGHIYTVPIEGGEPNRVTEHTPSYWHGWSPDGAWLTYCARRNDAYDIYIIPVDGGEEIQLTSNAGHNDGPDYSPDGRWIYFNSDRTGDFAIWRVPALGGDAEQITSDAFNDWFPHPSPDGSKIVFLSYEPGTEGHPRNRFVRLRLMDPDGSNIVDLIELFGGQGTINVPSWAPDSKEFAYVYYSLAAPD
jgi:Tol biopolymer transport system component